MILLVVLGSSPLEVFANVTYDPFNQFPDQTQREWPTKDYNNVATDLPEPPAMPNTVNMSDMFHYPELIYTDPGSVSEFPDQTALLASNRSYVTATDPSVAVITRDARWQSGVMWSLEENKIKLNEPFHMVAYVYLGKRTQYDRNFYGLGGADGITFTMHNDNKKPTDIWVKDKFGKDKLASGSVNNTGMNAYGALGNGLGVYGSNFSANVSSDANNMVDFWRGVENGITLEFDTFYNDNDTTQHSDNDLTSFDSTVIIDNESHVNTQHGHIAINLLNDFKDNKANHNVEPHKRTNKHKIKLSLGWDGEVSDKTFPYWWQISKWPTTNLADDKWHRLEVKWTPKSDKTGDLTYIIYRQGHIGDRNVSSIYDTSNDTKSSNDILTYTISDLNVVDVFDVTSTADSVYWGFSGSTGGFLNNQAVQMLQLPVPYYKSGIRKVDQDGNFVKNAKFQLQVLNGETWQPVVFQKAVGSETQDYVLTGVDNGLIGVTTDLDEASPTYGKVTATQLPKGTYRWVEIAAPEGYKIDSPITPTTGEFELKYNIENENESSKDFVVTNTKLSQIELYKIDNDTKKPLNGVKFTISKELDGVTSYLKAKLDNTDFEWTTTEDDAKQFETGNSYFVRDGKIEEGKTDEGYIRIGYIENGANLSWKEVKDSVPKGYDSSGELTGDFEPSTKDNGYVYSAEQTNSRLYQVSLEKIASDTNTALPGAVFSLQKKVDQNWETVSQDGVSEFTTNSEGKISIPNLEAGTYRWEEIQAPVGYKIKQRYYPDENDGFKVEYREGLEIDEISQNYNYDPTQVNNEPQDFELFLEKLSSTFQQPLENVSFTLYGNREGNTFSNEISTQKTNQEGKIVFGSDLIKADKTYYLVESQTVEGFIQLEGYFKIETSKVDGINVTYVKADTETDESPFEFTSTSTDTSYAGTLTIYNKRESTLPNTGGNGILGYVGIGLTMTIVALLFFIARKRNFKWLIILIVATSGLAGLAGGTQVVSAQEQEQVQLEVNRLVYQPSDTQYKSGVNVN